MCDGGIMRCRVAAPLVCRLVFERLGCDRRPAFRMLLRYRRPLPLYLCCYCCLTSLRLYAAHFPWCVVLLLLCCSALRRSFLSTPAHPPLLFVLADSPVEGRNDGGGKRKEEEKGRERFDWSLLRLSMTLSASVRFKLLTLAQTHKPTNAQNL